MPRPHLEVNKPSRPTVSVDPRASSQHRYVARVRVRLPDRSRPRDPLTDQYPAGPLVTVRGSGPTEDDAKHACAKALQRKQHEHKVATRASEEAEAARFQLEDDAQRLANLAEARITADLEANRLRESSTVAYRAQLNRLRVSSIGDMHVSEVDAGHIEAYLLTIFDGTGKGSGSARTTRSLLSRTFKYATLRGWCPQGNPVREGGTLAAVEDTHTKPTEGIDRTYFLEGDSRTDLAYRVFRDRRARQLDIRDMIYLGLATGARIGEVVALQWSHVRILDPELVITELAPRVKKGKLKKRYIQKSVVKAQVHFEWTATRKKGVGIVRTAPKTKTGDRTLTVPPRVAAMLKRRARAARVTDWANDERPVFPGVGRIHRGTSWTDAPAKPGDPSSTEIMAQTSYQWQPWERTEMWDPSGLARNLRALFDRVGYPQMAFHGLRRSAILTLSPVMPLNQLRDFSGHKSERVLQDSYRVPQPATPLSAQYL
jgi:integrase